VLRVPRSLDHDRGRRSGETVALPVTMEARVVPGVARLDLVVTVENTACDHRLRLLVPTGAPAASCVAATTFDHAVRSTAPRDDAGWVHPAPRTFPHQGWIHANGLTVVAPGLPEAEVTPDGTIAVTLLRAVGWLARYDVRTRPQPAGPPMETPGAQCPGPLVARLSLLDGLDARAARDVETGLRGVLGGPSPRLRDGTALLSVEPREVIVTAVKPLDEGRGIVVRVLNPTDAPQAVRLRFGWTVEAVRAVRLDETPAGDAVALDRDVARLDVPPHALRSVVVW
jgi:2-O-(6-phospho-alpha-D-mannosyl)-D-glycerate hydrolase